MSGPKMIFAVIAAIIVTTCNCATLEAGDQRLQSRVLGTLNRYYITSRSLIESGTDLYDLANTDAAVSQLSFLSANEKVVFLIHGRESSAYGDFATTVRDSLIKSDENVVVFLVDWAIIASMGYDLITNSVPYVADDIIDLIIRLQHNGKISRNLVHIVGFDVGAHIAGIVSRNPSARVQRITGLSPAGTNWLNNGRALRATDAEYVEVVHTDYTGTNAFGINAIIGTVDFFVNSGTFQPGCGDDHSCNHERSYEVFAAILDVGGHLVGLKCDDELAMATDQCLSGPALALGNNDLAKDGSGIYRVNTGSVYPYNA